MKMEQTVCSETSAYKIQTTGNYPEERTQYSEQGERFKIKKLWTRSQSCGNQSPWRATLSFLL